MVFFLRFKSNTNNFKCIFTLQKNKVFTLGPVVSNSVTIAPDVAAMIKSHTPAATPILPVARVHFLSIT